MWARGRVDELTAERTSLSAEIEQAKRERDTLGDRISELEAAAATGNGE